MERITLVFFLIIILSSNIFAKCSEEQININTASATELDKIIYVGPATATKIIDARPFDSMEDLIRVKGIGNITLEKIKTEGLACVENSEKEKETNTKEINEEEVLPEIISPVTNLNNEIKELQVIKLNSKDIKDNNSIQENKEGISLEKYASFGLLALGILVLILLFLQRKKDGLEY